MIRQGLVLLSQNDHDAPGLPAVAVVSKEDSWDDGGYQLGVTAAAGGALVVDRPYFTGHPDVEWLVGKVERNTAAGLYTQLGNELNLELEGWTAGPEAWFGFAAAVRAGVSDPSRCLSMPPSPGVPGWQDWVDPVGPYAVHAYGSSAQMQDVVRWYLDNRPGQDVYVTECNFGAGQQADVDLWAVTELGSFLDWCAGEERVKFVSYFAWEWRGAPPMPTPVDAKGTQVTDVLLEWTPPVSNPAWYPDAVQRPISRNYTPGRGGHTPYTIVDHIADGLGSPFGWFESEQSRVSSHFWVSKTGVVEQYRPTTDTTWTNGILCDPDLANPTVARIVSSGVNPNQVGISIEHEGHPGDVFPPAQDAATAELHAWLSTEFGIALDRASVIGHCQLDNCSRAHCPGPSFPWSVVLDEEEPMPSPEVIALQDALFSLAAQIQALQPRWQAEGQTQMAAYCAEQGEAIKRTVALSKGER